jgi:crossover junction endodeoxyribonuclease RusA
MSESFFVPGVPAPQGSKNHVGNGRMVESSKGLAAWRMRVGLAANQARHGRALHVGACLVVVEFVMPRPKALHGKRETPAAVKRPDLDKLVRGVLDALTGTLLVDDSLVTELHASKRIAGPAEQPGCEITVRAL